MGRSRAQWCVPRLLRPPIRSRGRDEVKVLVTGAGGLVGRAVVSYCRDQPCEVIGLDHRQFDISDKQQVQAVFDRARPEAVINCAAWTDVDGCEIDPHHAHQANAHGPELLALACREVSARLLTISTDYVFDGE